MRYAVLFACLATSCFALAKSPAGAEGSDFKAALSAQSTSEQSTKEQPRPNLSEFLESRVRAAWTAFKMRDEKKYAEFLADDFQAVEADGDGERSKARILREVQHSMYTDYLLQLFQVQPLGAGYAFVTYEATIQFPAGSAVRYKRVFVGELWSERGGQWKMMRYQETPVR